MFSSRYVRAATRSTWVPLALVACMLAAQAALRAEDWPEHRGKGDTGIWKETGILETFPPGGLQAAWRVPVRIGHAPPVVADGRVFVTDWMVTDRSKGKMGVERLIALDEKTGKELWIREWHADYTSMTMDNGTKATPTVDGDVVYVIGGAGNLLCIDVKTGEVLWKKDFRTDYHPLTNQWPTYFGWASPAFIDGQKVICLIGGAPDYGVVAFDKRSGKELWHAISAADGSEAPGFSPFRIVEMGGVRQLIAWNVKQISSLDPETGKIYWQIPFPLTQISNVISPVQVGPSLYFSAFYNGAMVIKLDETKPAASVLWKSKSDSEVHTDAMHNNISTPVVIGDYIYGIDAYGQLRCLKFKTGERVWETMAVVVDKTQFAGAHLVKNGDRVFINNDRGELIIAKLDPAGYHEISRTKLIKPTLQHARRKVNWSIPAYANKHIIARNDEEIVSYSLAADGQNP